MSYKQDVVDSAIRGMVQDGMAECEAEVFRRLFEVIYQSGYNEGLREQYITMLGSKR